MEAKNTSGIYRIENTVSGRVYIGSASSMKKRRNSHFGMLKKGTHHSKKLQRSFDKHGIGAFEFLLVEYVTGEDALLEREQYWIDLYDAANCGYNMMQLAGRLSEEDRVAGMERMKERWKDPAHREMMVRINKDRVFTDEHRRNMSEAAKRRFQDPVQRERLASLRLGIALTDEAKRKMSATSTGSKRSEDARKRMSEAAKERMKDPSVLAKFVGSMDRKQISDETRQKMRDAAKRRMDNPETREKISAANKGRVLSQETRAKIGDASRKRVRSEETRRRQSIGIRLAKASKKAAMNGG